ncbi:bifunctional riboflavin kinase/FAD synthetase [Halobacillus shinanisalinarum]|uniref:Riboflavin biosynthesis protein n=1 Tax=Halobacillus shinanisalinarum TaxID=2932258 RepID=A0ABY4H026_9BACI|nr:bifunctional riboflavin kinase/FAD synthetase [Halobacillus shinanisalinarum]UOQ93260.1 bifunctional riboflavin kinase/FAD synthetase [Halobacillus shinanisalinarum]
MKTIELSASNPDLTHDLNPSAVAVGFFDGVHKGHQEVIITAQNKADQLGLSNAVMTFDPHPSVVLNRAVQHARYITPLAEKQDILEAMGVDYLFVVRFDQSLAALSPQQFVDDFFVGLNIKHVVAGFDFSYGHKGKGSMETLPEHAQGRLTYTIVEKVEQENSKVSSTRIRKLLDDGEIVEVSELLGRPFHVRGTVVSGDERGRTIGYPTANMADTNQYYLPKSGVYAVKAAHQGEQFYGMANLGVKPTFQEDSTVPMLEIHLFDFDQDLYGAELTVYFHKYIRAEQKFNGIEQIVAQLENDEAEIRRFFKQ